jgi:hypothetical protein
MDSRHPFRLATIERCCEHQAEAADYAAYATTCLDRGMVGMAKLNQWVAAYHHEEARIRLERLLNIN